VYAGVDVIPEHGGVGNGLDGGAGCVHDSCETSSFMF
jgi:hypothetical protein